MAGIYPIGSVVRHIRYGRGIIQSHMDGGASARVRFDLLCLDRIISMDELVCLNPVPTPIITPAPQLTRDETPQKQEKMPKGGVALEEKPSVAPATAEKTAGEVAPIEVPRADPSKRLKVECLRQGLPPRGGLNSWTVGYNDIRNAIGKALTRAAGPEKKGSVIVLEAGYGQGKSHLGQLALEIAHSQRLLTMHTELDGRSVSLSNGMLLLARLFASAVLPPLNPESPQSVPGLATILKFAARHLHDRIPKGLELFSSFLKIANEWEGNEEAVELLERYLSGDISKNNGEILLRDLLRKPWIRLFPLKMNWGSIDDRFVAQAQQLARVMLLGMEAGARGALVVLDEFDHEIHPHLGFPPRARALLDNFCKLTEYLPIVFLLLTPAAKPLGLTGAEEICLPRLSLGEFRQVFRQTVSAYRLAFPDTNLGLEGREEEESLFLQLNGLYKKEFHDQGWGPRFFVRATIEACDRITTTVRPLSGISV